MDNPDDIDLFATAAFRIINDYYEITLYRPTETEVVFFANPTLHKRGWKREMNRRLAMIHASARIGRHEDKYRISVTRLTRRLGRPPLVNTLLFILTFLTVLMAAAIQESGEQILSQPSLLLNGIPFTIALMIILFVHEMGHFVAGHARGIIMSYPFFIPAPNIFGTFGAVIKTRTPIRSRNDLIAVGAMGPLAGVVPAVIALFWGYADSELVTQLARPPFTLGNSIITSIIQLLFFGNIPEGMTIDFSPIARAGQAGLLVTMLNLLPLGQLDGGHIVYGLFGNNQRRLAMLFMVALFGMGFYWNGWWIWLVLIMFLRPFHPPVLDNAVLPDRKHRLIGWAAVILFLLSFAPRPID